MSIAAVVAAAGRGERLAAGRPKALVTVAGRTLLEHSVEALLAGGVDVVVVAAPADAEDEVRRLVPAGIVVAGADVRQESVRRAVAALPHDVDVVLVHDAARALVPATVVRRVIDAVRAGASAVVPVIAVPDTVKEVDGAGAVHRTVDRTALRAAQTPQGFQRGVLEQAHAHAVAVATDDAALAEALGVTVTTVDGDAAAFKVTTPFDLTLAESILARRGAGVRA